MRFDVELAPISLRIVAVKRPRFGLFGKPRVVVERQLAGGLLTYPLQVGDTVHITPTWQFEQEHRPTPDRRTDG